MKHLVTLPATSCRRALVGAWLGLSAISSPLVAQTSTEPYYSKFATPASPAQYSVQVNGVACVNCGVANAERAADNVLTNYATVQNTIGAGNRAALRLALTGPVPATYRVGVIVGNGTTLNASALAAIVIRTYQGGVLQETKLGNAAGVTASALDGGRTRIDFIAARGLDQVEVEMTNVVNVLNTLDVYYAYAVPANVLTTATGYLSRLGAATAADYVASASGTLCVNTGVLNPINAVTPSLDDYAVSHVTGVGCSTTLQVRLENAAPAGYQAGFVIGNGSILDASILNGLRIRTYQNGVLQETGTAANLLQLNVLPDGRYQVSFATAQAFDRVELERTGLAGLLDDLNVYYGFGIEPRAFRDQTPVLSNFAAQTSGNYVVTGSCTTSACVSNPGRAVDDNLTDYAQMNFPLLGGTRRLRMRLNGNPDAGNRAGVALNINNGLLDASLLNSVTIRTYAADGTTVLESASGAGLLSTGLLGGGRQEVGFMTTQDFEWVEVEINSTAGLFSDAQIYYAFADDPVQGFPSNIVAPTPLPVELRDFTAKAGANGVNLTWETAQEKNSSYFQVERAAAADAAFEAVARVQAAGNATTTRRYAAFDADLLRQPAGTWYYRLRQVDLDGTTAFSAVRAVRWQPQGTAQLRVFPNPATDAVTVYLTGGAEAATVRLYTTNGQLVRRAAAPADGKLQLNGLTAGLYQVVVYDGRGQRLASQRLSVVR